MIGRIWARLTRREASAIVDQNPELLVTYSDPTAWMTASERRFHQSDQFGR